jgi:uncharacterized protein YjbI with pentapeptide repeats
MRIGLEELARMRAAHDEWLETDGARGARMDLPEDVDLSGIDMEGWMLSDAVLATADLSGARLAGANLGGAILLEASLEGADFRDAILGKADLGKANARGARFDGASLIRTSFSETDLRDASFVGASLTGTGLYDCDLRGSDFSGAKFKDALFENCSFAFNSAAEAVGTLFATQNCVALGGVDDWLDVDGFERWWHDLGATIKVSAPPGAGR